MKLKYFPLTSTAMENKQLS